MKLIVISDTHGNINEAIDVINNIENIDAILHLGDYTKDAKEIEDKLNIEVINVKGNCDISDKSTPEDKIIEIKDKKFFLTHGHKYNVKWGINNIYYKAQELMVDGVIFGHTHKSINIRENDIVIFNPGSITYPRGGSSRSYGIINVNKKIDANVIEL